MDPFPINRQGILIPTVTLRKTEDALKLTDAVIAGGIDAMEIALNTDGALEAVRAISAARPAFAVGAGKALTEAMADAAANAGASFISVPGSASSLIGYCLRRGYPVIPACASSGEASRAYEQGCRLLSLLPDAYPGGTADIESLSALLPGAGFVPEGVAPDDLGKFLAKDCVAACGSGRVIDCGEVESVKERCRQAVMHALGFELAHIGINNANRDQAVERANALAALFQMPVSVGNTSTYAGTAVEFMHGGIYGTVGHLGFFTSSASRAMAYFKRNGIGIIEESVRRDERGSVWFFYLEPEVFGFALHVMNRK